MIWLKVHAHFVLIGDYLVPKSIQETIFIMLVSV